MTLFARIFKHSEYVNGCTVWVGAKNKKGYGIIRVNRKLRYVHRVVFELFYNRNIKPSMLICHTCDNPACFEPSHLFEGTASDNQRDSARKGRTAGQKKTHCKNGHPLAGANLYLCPRRYRECKACRRRNVAKNRALHGRPERGQPK